jgi:hypothetical protein
MFLNRGRGAMVGAGVIKDVVGNPANVSGKRK